MVRSSTFTAINQIKMKIVAYNYYNATVANNYKYFTLIVSNTCIKVQPFYSELQDFKLGCVLCAEKNKQIDSLGLGAVI